MAEVTAVKVDDRRFPLQTVATLPWQRTAHYNPPGSTIPFTTAERAFKAFVQANPGLTLDRIAQRGGFTELELDTYLPDWRRDGVKHPAEKAKK